MIDLIVQTYVIYLVISILLTIWVARTLFKNGQIFLVDIFADNEALAQSVNKLLLVGFYLINIGYAVLMLRIIGDIETVRQMFEQLSYKVGAIILILGGMHFFNLFVFFRLRKRARVQQEEEAFLNMEPNAMH